MANVLSPREGVAVAPSRFPDGRQPLAGLKFQQGCLEPQDGHGGLLSVDEPVRHKVRTLRTVCLVAPVKDNALSGCQVVVSAKVPSVLKSVA